MRIAILEDATVVNIIEADEEFAKANHPGYRVLRGDEWCSLGATWDGKNFTPREPVEGAG